MSTNLVTQHKTKFTFDVAAFVRSIVCQSTFSKSCRKSAKLWHGSGFLILLRFLKNTLQSPATVNIRDRVIRYIVGVEWRSVAECGMGGQACLDSRLANMSHLHSHKYPYHVYFWLTFSTNFHSRTFYTYLKQDYVISILHLKA